MSGARFLVTGKVQGVWFRAATRERALALQLRGFARNLADGGVEVVATGADAALDELERWLWQGPPLAKVARVERSVLASGGAAAEAALFEGFVTL
jgi:acylphosphatase